VREEATGRGWTLYEGLEPGCMVAKKALEADDLSYRLEIHDPKGEAATIAFDYRPLPASAAVENSDEVIVIEAPDAADVRQHRLVIRDADSNQVLHDERSDWGRFELARAQLMAAKRYRARYFVWKDAGWAVTPHYWEFTERGATPASSAHILANFSGRLAGAGDGAIGSLDGILKLRAQHDGEAELLEQLAAFVMRSWKGLSGPEKVNRDALQQAARSSASADVSRHVRTALDYLSLWVEVERYFDEHNLKRKRFSEIFTGDEHLAGINGAIDGHSEELSTRYGLLMFKGMLASVRDRTIAADLFAEAARDEREFAHAQSLDLFASTYFTAEQVDGRRAKAAEQYRSLMGDFELCCELEPGGKEDSLIVFSCDARFFSVYFPYWASAVEYLREHNVSLHFVLVGEPDETRTVHERGVALAEAVVRLRGGDPRRLSEVLSFSTASVPRDVVDKTTFYACARYLFARKISSQRDGEVLLLDIDMTLRMDPSAFLRHLREGADGRLQVVMGGGMSSLIPARRFMAGTFLVPGGEVGDEALQHIEDYILSGLSCPRSWTLDQMALAYAVERVVGARGADTLMNIEGVPRPFAQQPINRLYEDGQRRLDRIVGRRRGMTP
jgi:hypothetical protein